MATTTFPTRDDFAAMLNESLGGENETFEGKVVKGIVTAIENDLAVIDVGLKSEGRVALREFAAPGQKAEIKVGDEVEVFVDRVENSQGEAMLSRDRARREAAWDSLEKEFEAGNRVEGVIFGRVKGGFTVDLGGAVAFLPGSQVDIRPVRDVGPLMEMPQPFADPEDGPPPRQYRRVAPRHPRRDARRAAQRPDPEPRGRPGHRRRGQEHHRLRCVRRPRRDRRPAARHRHQLQARQPPERSDQHRRHGEGADHPHQPRDAAHQPRHEAARDRSVGRRCGQVSDRRHLQGPGHEHHRIWCVRRARSRHRGPRPRLRDELDEEERPSGQDRLALRRKSK